MAKNPKQTSSKVASMASDLLRHSPNKQVRSVSASDLSQAHPHPKKAIKKK